MWIEVVDKADICRPIKVARSVHRGWLYLVWQAACLCDRHSAIKLY
jgi:hypothetical protein